MPTFEITITGIADGDDEESLEDAIREALFDIVRDGIDVELKEQEEYERCEQCGKKVVSTELEQNKGVCYTCAEPQSVEARE